MHPESELSWEQTQNLVGTLVFKHTGKHLSDIEIEVLQGAWEGKSYEEIAEQLFRSVSYINKDIGYRLWKKLSDALGEDVTKKSFRQALKREWQRQIDLETTSPMLTFATNLEFPDGPLALDSPFYIERPPIESDCYKEILKPGSLIRIRGPKQIGKTSLLHRVLAYAKQQNYQVVRLNLRKAEKTVFTNLNKFLRWFCLNVTRQLNIEPKLDDYWDEEIGSKVSCTGYFQTYLLAQLDTNLVIALDEIDTVFNYPDIAEDFLALLREWHEEAMIEESWRKLRLVIAHSTEVYISLNINQSPFNVGLPLRLPPFNQQQVQTLAQVHGLTWTVEETQPLTTMVEGHPYLIRLALYHLAHQDVTLGQLLQAAPTHAGIYSDHLRRCLGHVKQQPELAAALKQVVTAQSPVQLESVAVYQLDSMGLVHLNGNQVTPSCELYRQYFSTNLS
ncbi:AAA-like domain-containing protein [Coleofasciculus sp. H7-2]|uniref:AAA-like domain-containing protein n=1 Tax=Coleofasciculus sp. H7-2 TaxID=3351545 RepID=UPI00366B25E4